MWSYLSNKKENDFHKETIGSQTRHRFRCESVIFEFGAEKHKKPRNVVSSLIRQLNGLRDYVDDLTALMVQQY